MAEKLRVLIVDDQCDAADGLARVLTAMGHTALPAYNALDALIEAKDFGPDVVIVDISMPGFDGYDLVAELPKRHPRAVLVALTGRSPAEVQEHGGFHHILTKPASADTLSQLLVTIASGR